MENGFYFLWMHSYMYHLLLQLPWWTINEDRNCFRSRNSEVLTCYSRKVYPFVVIRGDRTWETKSSSFLLIHQTMFLKNIFPHSWRHHHLSRGFMAWQALIRFLAVYRIKPQAPTLLMPQPNPLTFILANIHPKQHTRKLQHCTGR